jgi:hypothetical protein
MLSSWAFTTYAKLESGSTATPTGCVPAGNGEPVDAVSTPELASIVYEETLPVDAAQLLSEHVFATNKNRPNGSLVAAAGENPSENGDDGSGVSTPVVAATEYADTLLAPLDPPPRAT